MTNSPIKVSYRAVDSFRMTRSFKTLSGARKFAHERIGEHPDIGTDYAVSFDGIGTIRCTGCDLADLFPADAASEDAILADIDRRMNAHNAAEAAAEESYLDDYWTACPPSGSMFWEM